jgi:hypothetical protein
MILFILIALFLFVLVLSHLRGVILSAFIIAAVVGLLAVAPDMYQLIVERPGEMAMIFAGYLSLIGVIYAANRPVRPQKPAAQTFAFKLGRRLGQLLLRS